jgi:polysaccharide biosynthesis/export protein
MNVPTKPSLLLACIALGALPNLPACAASWPYVWVQDLPQRQAADEYIILSGDLLAVKVFNQENMSTRARVRSDGKIALPFLGEVEVRGKSPSAVSKELEGRFKEYVVSPAVTINVEEAVPTSVSVLGEVSKPGLYTIDPSAGVLQALAVAGGLTDYASRESIYLVRRTPAQRIRFGYASLLQRDGRAAMFRLRAGDVLVVE